jgi:decaprenylphospho-beta-D-erythro-pentofuranosid-2-ulose 2-reductase
VSTTTPKRLLIVGGSSEIGVAIGCRMAAQEPTRAFLIGRDRGRMESAMGQLERGGCAPGTIGVVDADDLDEHQVAVANAFAQAGGFEVIVVAVGMIGGQEGLDADPDRAVEVMRVTFLGAGSLLLHCLRALRDQGYGTLVVLSSVAAERPRAANPIYGAAKAGLDALAQGLADANTSSRVRVLVVRPGFVKTRMTAGLTPAPLSTTPEVVARATVRGLDTGAHTIWVPGSLRPLFSVLRHLPRPLFRRLPL